LECVELMPQAYVGGRDIRIEMHASWQLACARSVPTNEPATRVRVCVAQTQHKPCDPWLAERK
jgi:hypothetical protein